MSRRTALLTAAVLPVVCALSACSSPAAADGRIQVVASTDVWGDVVTQVGGDAVHVTSVITDPSQDPHSYEANVKVRLAISRAAVIVENGGGYDDFMASLRTSSNTAPVIDAVDVSGFRQDADLNEHVWYDFRAVAKVADRIATELAAVDPSQAATFTANATAFDAKLGALEQQEATVKAADAGQGVAITEPVPLYLLDALGLVDRTPAAFSRAIEEGTDVAADVLARTLALFSDHTVAALVYNAQTSGPETQRVLAAARAAHVPVVPVTETLPAGQDYLSWMSANLTAVAAAVAR